MAMTITKTNEQYNIVDTITKTINGEEVVYNLTGNITKNIDNDRYNISMNLENVGYMSYEISGDNKYMNVNMQNVENYAFSTFIDDMLDKINYIISLGNLE